MLKSDGNQRFMTAQLERVPEASVILINVLGTGKAAFKIGFYCKVVSGWLFNRSTERSDDLRNAPSPISAKVWSLAAFCVIDATPRSRAIRCVSSCLWQFVLIKVLCCPKVESIFYQKLNISVCSFVVWFVSVYVCGDVDPSLKCSSDLAPARDSQLRDVNLLTHCGHVFSGLYLRRGFLKVRITWQHLICIRIYSSCVSVFKVVWRFQKRFDLRWRTGVLQAR